MLFFPRSGEVKILHRPPPSKFAEALRQRGVGCLTVGRVIVATVEPYDRLALEVVKEMQLELKIIYNKGAVMVLPTGVNKATGLSEALRLMGERCENVAAVGDAENDHSLLGFSGCGVAVANAVDPLKQTANYVTKGPHGEGVAELIDLMIADSLQQVCRCGRSEGTGKDSHPPQSAASK